MAARGRVCGQCGKAFADSANLRRHCARKTPCQPVVEPARARAGATCRYCNRGFASPSSMYRHVRQACRAAPAAQAAPEPEPAAPPEPRAAPLSEPSAAGGPAERHRFIEKLSALLAEWQGGAPRNAQGGAPAVGGVAGIIAGNVVQYNTVVLAPWDSERRISVSAAQMAAAFEQNSRLREFARLSDGQQADPDVAPPYVAELLVDLVKRAHEDPAARNVYLNPQRADQALVHLKSGGWEVLPLVDATRMLFDGVARSIHRVTLSNGELRHLPLDAQNALATAGLLYESGPDLYATLAKSPMTAHLANTAPPRRLPPPAPPAPGPPAQTAPAAPDRAGQK